MSCFFVVLINLYFDLIFSNSTIIRDRSYTCIATNVIIANVFKYIKSNYVSSTVYRSKCENMKLFVLVRA